MNKTTRHIKTIGTFAVLLPALSLCAAADLASAAPGRGQFTGMIESVELSDGPWLTLSGPKGRRSFLCEGFSEDCARWQCRDLGRRVTVHYVTSRETLEGGETGMVDSITRVDGPTGPADAEMNRVRCAADGLRATGDGSPEAAAAANSLGVWYEKGTHGLRRDAKAAKDWYETAAEHGNALAMHNLGDLYRQGKGVRQNSREAFRWYKKAADAGSALGLEDLADCYLKGVGAPPNRDEALRLYREAARQGRKSAAQKLREMGE